MLNIKFMCGFVGIINNNIFSKEELSEKISNLNNLISHRGPDNQKIYIPSIHCAFGFSRLSIQDISSLADQPFLTTDKRFIISFNGEIYNFLEIKKKIKFDNYNFKTTSDTEVIAALIVKYGVEQGLKYLKGMYAIAIYDNFENKLYLHKDLYGKKPLYYLIYKNTFFFSSEISQTFIKNIKKISNEELDVNFFMNFGFCKNHINKKVFSVDNSEFIEFNFKNNEIIKKNKYFFDYDSAEGFNTSNNFNHFENILEKSVSRRLISDRPIGLFLSSGFDSNIIAHYASKLSKKKIKAYTLGFQNSKNYNELKFQKELANSLNFDFESVHVDEDIITNEINSVVELDLPIADPSFFLEKYLCNYAKQEIDVVLTGDGGDEIFGGYNRYKFLNIYKRLFSKLNKTIIFKFADLLKKFEKNNFLKNNIFKKILSSQSYEDKFEKIIAILKSSSLHESYFNLLRYDIKNNNINSFNSDFDYSFFEKFHGEKNFQIYDLIFYMQHNILFKIDRASMLNGLEIRSPFLDEEILKNFFYSGLNKPNKYLLKKLSKKLGIKKYINKNKMGFSFDIQDYLLKKSEDLIFELNNINNCFNNDQKKNIIDNYNKYKNGNKYNFWFIWKFYILNKYLNAK